MALDPKLQKFTTASPIISSVDWENVAAGTGIQNYYPIAELNSGGTEYHLIETPYNSAVIELSTGAPTTYTFQSLDFNLPRFVKGTAYFSGNFYDGAASQDKITAKLQKWDGSSATDLTATHTSANGVTSKNNIVFFSMPITTEANIAVGESLRLVVVYTKTDGNSKLGISPTNQTSPTGNLTPTQMIIGVPYAQE